MSDLVPALEELLGADAIEALPGGGVAAMPDRAATIAELLRWAAAEAVAVRTETGRWLDGRRRFPARGEVLLRLDRLQASLVLDRAAGTVIVPGGTTGADLAWRLHREGRWIPPRSAPFYTEPIGVHLAGAGLAGEMAALTMWESPLMALEAVLADGRVLHSGVAPRSAAGPDYRAFLLGCRDRIGVITSATWRTHHRTVPMLFAARLRRDGLELLAESCRRGWRPFASMWLPGEDARCWREPARWTGDGETVLLCYRAEADRADLLRRQLAAATRELGGEVLEPNAARPWFEGTFLDVCQRGRAAVDAAAEAPLDGQLATAWIAASWPALRRVRRELEECSLRCVVSGEGFRPEGGILRVRLASSRRMGLGRILREVVAAAGRGGGRLAGFSDLRGRSMDILAECAETTPSLERIAENLGPRRVLNPPSVGMAGRGR